MSNLPFSTVRHELMRRVSFGREYVLVCKHPQCSAREETPKFNGVIMEIRGSNSGGQPSALFARSKINLIPGHSDNSHFASHTAHIVPFLSLFGRPWKSLMNKPHNPGVRVSVVVRQSYISHTFFTLNISETPYCRLFMDAIGDVIISFVCWNHLAKYPVEFFGNLHGKSMVISGKSRLILALARDEGCIRQKCGWLRRVSLAEAKISQR